MVPPEPRPVPPVDPGPALTVLALLGVPEVRPGDDLPALLLDALASTPGALPLTSEDVLVVTQKVVSKAEGAIVDLAGIVPRQAAVDFARAWDRDARQLEVVLREARRVVRMDHGVLITETPHGFICANGGVDASNVGPASGSVVTLLPADSDASAARIRGAIRDRHGIDVPVVISDSFGRPWRWGIVDVAIGVAGLLPIEDLRGSPDRDGRVMKSTSWPRPPSWPSGRSPAGRPRSSAAPRSPAARARSATRSCPPRGTSFADLLPLTFARRPVGGDARGPAVRFPAPSSCTRPPA
jgi:coenzyme F420-0:L-glutamate ligase/coenzyme F420-1:gamma-L-glutamate ligase